MKHKPLQGDSHLLRQGHILRISSPSFADLAGIDPCILAEANHERIVFRNPAEVSDLAQTDVLNDLPENYPSLFQKATLEGREEYSKDMGGFEGFGSRGFQLEDLNQALQRVALVRRKLRGSLGASEGKITISRGVI